MLFAGVWVSFADFDFVHQGYYQLSGDGFQLQEFFGPLHQIGLLLGLFVAGELCVDFGKALFHAGFFLQEGLIQLGELAIGKEAADFIQLEGFQR